MMKIFLITAGMFLFQVAGHAQKKERAEAAFLKKINSILKHSPESGLSMHDESTMFVDSLFQIKAGVLSVAVHYVKDSSVINVRAEAPISMLENVEYDYYLVLIFRHDTVAQQEIQNGVTTVINKDLVHLGIPRKDGYKEKEKIKKLIDNLLVFYKSNPVLAN